MGLISEGIFSLQLVVYFILCFGEFIYKGVGGGGLQVLVQCY